MIKIFQGYKLVLLIAILWGCQRLTVNSEKSDLCRCTKLKEAIEAVPMQSLAWTNWSLIDTIIMAPQPFVSCSNFVIKGRVKTDGTNGPFGKIHEYRIVVIYKDMFNATSLGELHSISNKIEVKPNHILLAEIIKQELESDSCLSFFSLKGNQKYNFQEQSNCGVKPLETGRY